MEIVQECKNECKIFYTKKTVDWLVSNTRVRTFNKLTFEGYQRDVNISHVHRIVEYLNNNSFYLPTAIICASNDSFSDETELNIVDGQHRIESFKKLREKYPDRYQKICEMEIPVVVLEKPTEALEVSTFITINKTSRKVDTSLAYVLRNKIRRQRGNSDSIELTHKEYIAVELAISLNADKESVWYNRITLQGNPTQNSYETISLNSFVNSMKSLINFLSKKEIIDIDWSCEESIQKIIDSIKEIYGIIWEEIGLKWPELLDSKNVKKSVLQGTIGVTSINKYINLQLINSEEFENIEVFKIELRRWIRDLNIESEVWYKGNRFSQFSSASGFNIVSKILLESYKK